MIEADGLGAGARSAAAPGELTGLCTLASRLGAQVLLTNFAGSDSNFFLQPEQQKK